MLAWLIAAIVVALIVILVFARSFHSVGPAQVGLVNKRVARKGLDEGNPVALNGEAGYQAKLLMPGLRFKMWPIYSVQKYPWVQVPTGEIGVVIAQVGRPLPIGAKSAEYRPELGNWSDIGGFVKGGGTKGVQRPVLPPGTLMPIHPRGSSCSPHTASTACRWLLIYRRLPHAPVRQAHPGRLRSRTGAVDGHRHRAARRDRHRRCGDRTRR